MTEQNRRYWNESIETLPREALEQLQLTRLRNHLVFAYENSPYYRDAFIQAGVNPYEFTSLADLRAYPFVDKKVERTRQLAKPLLGDMLAVPEQDVVYVSASPAVPVSQPSARLRLPILIITRIFKLACSGLQVCALTIAMSMH